MSAQELCELEVAATVIQPYFDAVRDVFAEYDPDGTRLSRLRRTRLIIDPAIHDSPRHYAGCRDDGLEVLAAPEIVDLPPGAMVAILTHEMGHAADFAYPGQWLFVQRRLPAEWVGAAPGKRGAKARKLWNSRSDDQVEWTADAIAFAVTGKRIGYCGRCMIQCFEGGKNRPAGLI